VLFLGQYGIYLELKVGNFQRKHRKWGTLGVLEENSTYRGHFFVTKIKKELKS
jgi:hypothetical protein